MGEAGNRQELSSLLPSQQLPFPANLKPQFFRPLQSAPRNLRWFLLPTLETPGFSQVVPLYQNVPICSLKSLLFTRCQGYNSGLKHTNILMILFPLTADKSFKECIMKDIKSTNISEGLVCTQHCARSFNTVPRNRRFATVGLPRLLPSC